MSRFYKILLVEPDPCVLEMVVEALERRFDAQISCVADAEACLDVASSERHDLVITETELPTLTGVKLAEYLQAFGVGPTILLADRVEAEEVIQALRAGVRDVFCKPFAMNELLDAVDRLLHGCEVRRLHARKYRRMRDLVRRVLRERKELNRRMDLICKDLVGAHRRLVTRVLQTESTRSESN